ncbi:MAG: response regulator [Dechloromonas sp.]|nr:response regulator [Dechloromonas sp.]
MPIFVVDDSPIMLDVLSDVLAEVATVETFTSAAACLARCAEVSPAIYLLDVAMPDIDGIALCRQLKADEATADIPVIFFSANDDIDTRLRCYEVGGVDFIRKPFDTDELLRKLRVALQMRKDHQHWRDQAGYAQRTAMSAMISMGELGVVLQFLSKSFACRDGESLAAALLEALNQYGLDGAVQLRAGEQVMSYSHEGENIPLAVSVLNHVRDAGRIFQFKSRCVFNYGQVTLLINNLPVDDVDRCGRIRDNGALLAEGADARLRAIEAERLAHQRRAGIESALPQVRTTLEALQGNYRRNCFEITQTMIDFQESLLKSFVHLGLTEGQEEHMTILASDFMQRMVGTQDESLKIVGELETLANCLENLVKD